MTGKKKPEACAECMRRSHLLAKLGPYIERYALVPGRRLTDLLRMSNEALVEAVAPQVTEAVASPVASMPAEQMSAELEAAECWAVCVHHPLYPVGLRDAPDAPTALIGQGDPSLLGRLEPQSVVAVVGSRRATNYGREVARELGREIARAGLAVISGMAFGIDACVHRGALESGLTVAVLGCGADVAYPASHRSLRRRIAENGLVLSGLPPGSGAWRWTFPARNRILAALAGMTVVVEAAERSGSLITADAATELGRDLGAVPGPVGSVQAVGPNNLLAGGASVIRGAQDVLDTMLGPRTSVQRAGLELDDVHLAVLGALECGLESDEAIASKLELSRGRVRTALADLESHGYPSGPTARACARETPHGAAADPLGADPTMLRLEAERVIGEDRVPGSELERLITRYGGAVCNGAVKGGRDE